MARERFDLSSVGAWDKPADWIGAATLFPSLRSLATAFALVIAFAAVAPGAVAGNESAEERSQRLKREAFLYDLAQALRRKAIQEDRAFADAIRNYGASDGSCAQGWPIVWEVAKTGNKNVLSSVAASVTYAGLTPPGYPTEPPLLESLHRLRLLFTIYAMPTVRYHYPNHFNSVMGLLYRERDDTPALWAFYRCLQRAYFDDDAEACLSFAMQRGVVPSFEAFVAEVDARATENPDAVARCLVFESMAREAARELERQD